MRLQGSRAARRSWCTLDLDTEKREVTPPADFVKALKAAPTAWERWRALSYTHQREHVEAIEDAKKAETRARRIAAAVAMLVTTMTHSAAASAWLAARSLLWTLLLPGLLAGYVPWRYFGVGGVQVSLSNPAQVLGLLLIGAGALLLGACILEFARSGRGAAVAGPSSAAPPGRARALSLRPEPDVSQRDGNRARRGVAGGSAALGVPGPFGSLARTSSSSATRSRHFVGSSVRRMTST